MSNIELGVGPMSMEIVEAVYRYSHYHRKDLMLIASKNQIDHNGGYVNRWNTQEFMAFIKTMDSKYPNSKVRVCRDHCGPGFNGIYDLQDTYKTIGEDIRCGFDLIHIDLCHMQGTNSEKLEESKKAIEYCLKLNPEISLEIGTDENLGDNYSVSNLEEMECEVDFFTRFCKPEFYVIQTGSLVKEINQVGKFNESFVKRASEMLRKKGLKLKEHNADYLSKDEIIFRKGIVDSQNIAPQLGVVQTMHVLNKCRVYGIDYTNFENIVYLGGKWKKWLNKNTPENKFLCLVIAGHYHFSSPEYKEISSKLEERENISESIIDRIMEVINHYA